MKKRFLIVLFTVSQLSFSYAQSLTPVLSGEGTLEEAILAAEPDDILQLSGGGEYTLSSSSTSFGKIEMPLTIQVEPGATEKAVLKLGPDAPLTKRYYFFTVDNGAELTLRGLDIHGLLNDTVVAASMLVFDARPDPSLARIGNFRFENCIFHDFKDYVIHGMKDDYARGLIQDTAFIDDVVVYHAKHFLQYKHVSLRHLEMTNSTVYDLDGMALKIGKIGYRCVLENPTKPYIPITDETITPTGFIDHCTLDDMGDIHGHIQVDDAFHTLVISNCIISNQQQYDQPPVYFTEPRVDTAVIIRNTCFWKCGPPNSDVGGTEWIGYVFEDTLTYNPDYLNADTGDFTLPGNSPLLTFGTDRKAIGDPRWVADATGVTPEQVKDASTSFLYQNFPNPFDYSTIIRYKLCSPDYVVIKILDIQGREITSLVNEYQPAGKYSVNWNANSFENGIYFCKMQTGSSISVKKMMLSK
jgi:hypothetical protein